MKKLKSQQGLTLVEVLAALVILGIVFIGIMTVFPQMTLFNNKTEAKLDTMNLARQEMVNITAPEKWQKIILKNPIDPATNISSFLSEAKINDEMTALGYSFNTLSSTHQLLRFERLYEENSKKYMYELDVYVQCEEYTDSSTSGCEEEEKDKLYKVHLKVLVEPTPGTGNYVVNSETFSYLTYSTVNETSPESAGD
ncbi:type IV pilus modification PilV family protein [Planococcus plakortidis]|uniref:type IV pilus modification PilV family protein n=1 Tax=Planococcus plakortidis TaxID=1038856 RepID=UPI0039854260